MTGAADRSAGPSAPPAPADTSHAAQAGTAPPADSGRRPGPSAAPSERPRGPATRGPDRPSGLAAQPRIRLGTLPTPLLPAPRLSEAVGVEIWLKRDDLTGLGLGGNKVRGLEFLLADALARGCDTLVTGGGPGSNWAMLAALAARTRGLDTVLVCYGDPVPPVGNMHLATTIGADIRFTGDKDRASVDVEVAAVADELRAAGRTPYPMGRGGATAVGALGYLTAGRELAVQLADAGCAPTATWLATGSCGTQAGLVAGAAWQGLGPVLGVTVSRPAEECVERVATIARAAADLAGVPAPDGPPTVVDGHIGPGYGMRSPGGDAAAELVARTEGVFLDPIFAAKAMAGLLAAIRRGEVAGPVVFLVTGGAPTLFTTR